MLSMETKENTYLFRKIKLFPSKIKYCQINKLDLLGVWLEVTQKEGNTEKVHEILVSTGIQ